MASLFLDLPDKAPSSAVLNWPKAEHIQSPSGVLSPLSFFTFTPPQEKLKISLCSLCSLQPPLWKPKNVSGPSSQSCPSNKLFQQGYSCSAPCTATAALTSLCPVQTSVTQLCLVLSVLPWQPPNIAPSLKMDWFCLHGAASSKETKNWFECKCGAHISGVPTLSVMHPLCSHSRSFLTGVGQQKCISKAGIKAHSSLCTGIGTSYSHLVALCFAKSQVREWASKEAKRCRINWQTLGLDFPD